MTTAKLTAGLLHLSHLGHQPFITVISAAAAAATAANEQQHRTSLFEIKQSSQTDDE